MLRSQGQNLQSQKLKSCYRGLSQNLKSLGAVPPTLSMPGIQALALSDELQAMGAACGDEARVMVDQQGTAFAVAVTANDARGWTALVALNGQVSRDGP